MMNKVKRMCVTAVLALVAATISGQAFAECGVASYYTMGHTTANGEAYNHRGISAAHKTLPFGTRVQVTNRRTGRSIIVRINDRGPFIRGRIIDLSSGARNAFGMDGLANVCLNVVSYGNGARVRSAASRRSRGVRTASYRSRKGVRLASYRRKRGVRTAAYRGGKGVRYASKRNARYTKLSRKRQYSRIRRNGRYAQVSRARKTRG